MNSRIKFFIILIIILSLISLFGSINNSENDSAKKNKNKFNKSFNHINKLNYTNVLYLDDSNYTQELNKSELNYILFYDSDSEHCQNLMEKFIETADYCKDQKLNILFSRIEINKSPKSSEEYDAFFYPTLLFLVSGRKHMSDGRITTKEGLIHFMEKSLNDNIFNIEKLEELNAYSNMTDLLFLSTIKNKSSLMSRYYYDFAQIKNKYDFLSCISEECLKKYGEDIILFKKFDEKENSYIKDYGGFEEAKDHSLIEFLSMFGMECGTFLTVKKLSFLIEFDKKAIIYVRNNSIEEETKYDKIFKQLGIELRKNNTYTYISDLGEKGDTNIEEAFSILPEELPCIFYYNQSKNDPIAEVKIYSLRNVDLKKINIEYIKKFIKDVDDGKIRRDLFSEPPSESKFVDGLKYVIGRTYDVDVIFEKKNVFLAVTEDEEQKEVEKKFLNILRNISNKYKEISFTYININKNEPRDFFARDEELPIAFLYTNAMAQKRIIKFIPKNFTNINEKEILKFLDENIRKIKRDENLKAETHIQTDL